MGQNISVEPKKQNIPDNEDDFNESNFIVSDSDDIFISSQEASKDYEYNDFRDEGTAWIGGSRHSLREPHRHNREVEQRLLKLRIQLKNEK